MDDERDPTPESESQPTSNNDERFAPPGVDDYAVEQIPIEVIGVEGQPEMPSNARTEVDSPGDAPDEGESDEINERFPAAPGLTPDDVDIDAALAAVPSLSDFIDIDEEEAETDYVGEAPVGDDAEVAVQADSPTRRARPPALIDATTELKMPPMATLPRGSIASLVPALSLIAIGAWLTYALNSLDTPPDTELVAAVVSGALVATLLAQWISASRWSPGSLFFAVFLLLATAATYVIIHSGTLDADEGWPLYLGALGMAFVSVGLVARPVVRRAVLPGLVVFVGGVAGLGVTTGALDENALDTIASLWPVIAAVFAVLWLLPLIFRQRK